MFNWLSVLTMLAEEGQNQPQQPESPLAPLLFPMLAIAFLWYFLLFRPQKRDQGKRNEMLSALKKNDRVVTIGGIIGSVANISADGKEVTLKVDDNSRIKFLRSSIQSVIKEESADDSAK